MTAPIQLNAVWLHSATDLSDCMAFTMVGDSLKVSSSVQVTAQEMAGGRVRLVTRPGKSRSMPVAFARCTADQVAWLGEHEGQIVCARDHKGTKFFGYYSQVSVTEAIVASDPDDVEVSISSVTFSEAV